MGSVFIFSSQLDNMSRHTQLLTQHTESTTPERLTWASTCLTHTHTHIMTTCLILCWSLLLPVQRYIMGTLTGLWLCTQQTAMHCVFGHLSIRTSINFYSNLSNSSSSVGSDHMGQRSLLLCISESWPPMTLLPVHPCSFLGPLIDR